MKKYFFYSASWKF